TTDSAAAIENWQCKRSVLRVSWLSPAVNGSAALQRPADPCHWYYKRSNSVTEASLSVFLRSSGTSDWCLTAMVNFIDRSPMILVWIEDSARDMRDSSPASIESFWMNRAFSEMSQLNSVAARITPSLKSPSSLRELRTPAPIVYISSMFSRSCNRV